MDNNDNSITNPVNDDDKVLLENGIVPNELDDEERKELLTDFKGDNYDAENDELGSIQSGDESDGTDPA